jgi:hypothetical protein
MELNVYHVLQMLSITLLNLSANNALEVKFTILQLQHANALKISFGMMLNAYNAIILDILTIT